MESFQDEDAKAEAAAKAKAEAAAKAKVEAAAKAKVEAADKAKKIIQDNCNKINEDLKKKVDDNKNDNNNPYAEKIYNILNEKCIKNPDTYNETTFNTYFTEINDNNCAGKNIDNEKIIKCLELPFIKESGTKESLIKDYIKNSKNKEELIEKLVETLKKKREALNNEKYNENPKNTKIEYLKNLETKLESEIDSINKYKKVEMKDNFNKIQELTKTIEYLNNHIKLNQISNVRAKTLKSLENGLKLSISEIDQEICNKNNQNFKTKYETPLRNKNPDNLDDESIIKRAKLQCLNENSIGKNVYLVNLNDQCLEVNGSGDYSLKPCENNKKQQYFVLKDVYNPEIYSSHFEKSSLKLPIPKNLKYPFSMVKSLNSDSCLQNFNNNISIQPCSSKKSQRWKKLEKEKYC